MQWKALTLFVILASSFVSAAPKPYGVGASEANQQDVIRRMADGSDFRPDWYQQMISAQNGNETAANDLIQRYKRGLHENYQATSTVTGHSQYQLPAQLSQAAYCNIPAGGKVGDTQIVWSTGDGKATPHTFVGFSPSLGIVVSHQGTNPLSPSSLLNDAQFVLTPVDQRLSYLGSQSQVHRGFQATWLRTADAVLSQVRILASQHPGSPVFTTGHSLGAALSLLDTLYLKTQFPSNRVSSIVFGLPRTDNQQFSNAVDRSIPGFTHINNGHDPIPRLPGTFLGGFEQVSGEIWINLGNSNSAVSCPGQENMHCTDSVNPVQFNILDHVGIYFDVWIAGIGSQHCPARIGR